MTLPNTILQQRSLQGEEAFVYGLKQRAKSNHCLGYATFTAEVDALGPLRKKYCRDVAPITNLSIFVKALALAISQNPKANAILFRRWLGPRIVQFEHVDVNLPITREIDGRSLTFIGTIRRASEKTLAEIQRELTHLQRCDPEESASIQRILRLTGKPLWLARLVHWRMGRDPRFYISNVGTCGLTLGEGHYDHMFPIAPTSTVIGLGSPRQQAVVRGEAVAIARVVNCTLMVDNFVVPGLVGERVIRDFKALLESGCACWRFLAACRAT